MSDKSMKNEVVTLNPNNYYGKSWIEIRQSVNSDFVKWVQTFIFFIELKIHGIIADIQCKWKNKFL